MVWIGIFSSAPGSRRIGGRERRRARAPRSVVVVPAPGGSEGEGVRARGDARRARGARRDRPGVVSERFTARDERYDDGSTTVFGRLGASRGDTHVGLELGLLLLLDDGGGVLGVGDGRGARTRGGPRARRRGRRNARADALEPLRAMEPAEGAGAPTRAAAAGWCARRARRRRARGRRWCSRSRPPLFVACPECGGALERCEMRARGAQPHPRGACEEKISD